MEPPDVPSLQYAKLPNRSGVKIAYNLSQIALSPTEHIEAKQILIVFINGLGLPQAFWQPAIDIVKQKVLRPTFSADHHELSLLTYDRYGQGLSTTPESMPEPHDVMAAVHELDAMIQFAIASKLSLSNTSRPVLFLVAHSIGVPIARLYCQEATVLLQRHKGHTTPLPATALLTLDSNMANTDFVSIFPDPSSPAFDPVRDLPPDTTVTQLEWTRENYYKLFHPSASNPENFDRSTLPSLLPHSHSPVLIGPDGRSPICLIVVSHDPKIFERESLKISTAGLTDRYMEPAWRAYNLGLLNIGRTIDGREDVVVARDCGHFVQRDGPECVAAEILRMLDRLLILKSCAALVASATSS